MPFSISCASAKSSESRGELSSCHAQGFKHSQQVISFQDRAKEVAWGKLDSPPKDASSKKRVRVAMGPNADPNSGITMIVEGNGKVSIVGEDGQGKHLCKSGFRPFQPTNFSYR